MLYEEATSAPVAPVRVELQSQVYDFRIFSLINFFRL
jgi:hypothetical protein